MLFEVELKFHLAENSGLHRDLDRLGAVVGNSVIQTDRYFNHPARDFRATNEAFRIRSNGESNCMTYKGPVLDHAIKMRRELEIGFAAGQDSADQMLEMVALLGFRHIANVHKIRTPLTLNRMGRAFELAIDEVPGIGKFLEIELVVEDAEREAAKNAILELASLLNLGPPERRSYLELVLAQKVED